MNNGRIENEFISADLLFPPVRRRPGSGYLRRRQHVHEGRRRDVREGKRHRAEGRRDGDVRGHGSEKAAHDAGRRVSHRGCGARGEVPARRDGGQAARRGSQASQRGSASARAVPAEVRFAPASVADQRPDLLPARRRGLRPPVRRKRRVGARVQAGLRAGAEDEGRFRRFREDHQNGAA